MGRVGPLRFPPNGRSACGVKWSERKGFQSGESAYREQFVVIVKTNLFEVQGRVLRSNVSQKKNTDVTQRSQMSQPSETCETAAKGRAKALSSMRNGLVMHENTFFLHFTCAVCVSKILMLKEFKGITPQ